jgi:hypothetical protein
MAEFNPKIREAMSQAMRSTLVKPFSILEWQRSVIRFSFYSDSSLLLLFDDQKEDKKTGRSRFL